MLNSTRDDIRQISHELMPPNMHFSTLSQMLQAYTFKLSEIKWTDTNEKFTKETSSPIKVSFQTNHDYDWALLPQQIGYQLYRITQELVSNLMKHGEPSFLNIALFHTTDKSIELTIESDGLHSAKDFCTDESKTTSSEGIGLRSIRERIKSLGAGISIDGQKVYIRCSEKVKEVNN